MALTATNSEFARKSALDCLTAAIYYEAAREGEAGQRAVAQVVLNRVRHPAFPKTVCGVVFQGAERTTGCQFSFTCDGSLARRPARFWWDTARGVAARALAGEVDPAVGTATHYHTVWILPYWASSLDKITTIGAHIFYRWRGFWGQRRAFSGRYLAAEPALSFTSDGHILFAAAGPGGAQTPFLAYPDAQTALGEELAQPTFTAPRSGVTVPDLPILAPPSALLADQQRGALAADERSGELLTPTPALP